jgi:hypothetical protein
MVLVYFLCMPLSIELVKGDETRISENFAAQKDLQAAALRCRARLVRAGQFLLRASYAVTAID